MPGPLSGAHAVTKLPAQDLDRARRFYRDKLGLEPVEEREGGLRFICAGTEFHLFSSSGAASGASTQMGFEVTDLKAVIDDLRRRGVTFEAVELPGFEMRGELVVVPNNYPSKDPESSAPSSTTAKGTSSPSARRLMAGTREAHDSRRYARMRDRRPCRMRLMWASMSSQRSTGSWRASRFVAPEP